MFANVAVTYAPRNTPATPPTHVGKLQDLEPLSHELTNEDIHYWTHRDDEEDEAIVQAILDAEDPQEAFK